MCNIDTKSIHWIDAFILWHWSADIFDDMMICNAYSMCMRVCVRAIYVNQFVPILLILCSLRSIMMRANHFLLVAEMAAVAAAEMHIDSFAMA